MLETGLCRGTLYFCDVEHSVEVNTTSICYGDAGIWCYVDSLACHAHLRLLGLGVGLASLPDSVPQFYPLVGNK